MGDIIDFHDELLALHLNIIREDAFLLTKESEIIGKSQNESDNYDIDLYVRDTESIVKKKLMLYGRLQKKIERFKLELKEE